MSNNLEAVYGSTVVDAEQCIKSFKEATTHFKQRQSFLYHEDGSKTPYQHQVIASAKKTGRYETAVLYHSGYNGNALSEEWEAPNLCNNLFLAVQELIAAGYEPAQDIIIHTMSHPGSGEAKGVVHGLGSMVECVDQSLQKLPTVSNYGLYGSSMGVDLLMKGFQRHEDGRTTKASYERELPLRGVFGVSSALNGFDDNKFTALKDRMNIAQSIAYAAGYAVNVDGYRVSKAFEKDALGNLMDGFQGRFRRLNMRFLHAEKDGVVPYVEALGKAESLLGRHAEFVEMNFETDGVQAHLARSPENLKFIREQTKDWLVKVCEGRRAQKLSI